MMMLRCGAALMLLAATAFGEVIPASEDWLYVSDEGRREFDIAETVDLDLSEFFEVDSGSLATVSVSGLPTGIRYNAKTQRFSGQTKKKGIYYVTCSAKNKNGYQMSATTRWIVGDATEGDYDDIGLVDELKELDELCVGESFGIVMPGVKSASGLPTGLDGYYSYCSEVEGFEVSGIPSKAGKYRITFTDFERHKTVKTVIVRDAECRYQEVEVGNSSFGRGTVSGYGVKKPGVTVRISAKAARGYYFAGWYTDADCTESFEEYAYCGVSDYLQANQLFRLPSEEFALYAKFVTKEEDSDIGLEGDEEWAVDTNWTSDDYWLEITSLTSVKLTAKGLPTGVKLREFGTGLHIPDTSKLKPGTSLITLTAKNLSGATATKTVRLVVPNLQSWVFEDLEYEGIAYSYTVGESDACREPFCFSAEEGWSVSASGLPPGLKLSFDKTTGEATLLGMATKAGLYTVTLTAKNGRQTEKATFTIEVKPFPTEAVGTFNGILGWDLPPVEDVDDAAADVLDGVDGTVSLTVAANGKCSVKLVSAGKTYSFSGYPCTVSTEDQFVNISLFDARENWCDLYLDWSPDGAVANVSGAYECGDGSGNISGASVKALAEADVTDVVASLAKADKIKAVTQDGELRGPEWCTATWERPTLFFTVNKNGTIRSSGKIEGRAVSGSSILRVSGVGNEAVLFADFYDYKAGKGKLVYRVKFPVEDVRYGSTGFRSGSYALDCDSCSPVGI